MSKKWYVGVNNVAREVKHPYIGVNNVARKVKSGYVGAGGVAREFYPPYVWKKYDVTYAPDGYKRVKRIGCSCKGSYGFRLNDARDIYMSAISIMKYGNMTIVPGYCNTTPCLAISPGNVKRYSCDANTGYSYNFRADNGYVFIPGVSDASVDFDGPYEDDYGDEYYDVYINLTCSDLLSGTFRETLDASPRSYPYMVTSFVEMGPDSIDIYSLKTVGTKGNYICDVVSDKSTDYPTNGIHTDGYWYIKQ